MRGEVNKANVFCLSNVCCLFLSVFQRLSQFNNKHFVKLFNKHLNIFPVTTPLKLQIKAQRKAYMDKQITGMKIVWLDRHRFTQWLLMQVLGFFGLYFPLWIIIASIFPCFLRCNANFVLVLKCYNPLIPKAVFCTRDKCVIIP